MKFRFHKGRLDESMATQFEFKNKQEEYINDKNHWVIGMADCMVNDETGLNEIYSKQNKR